MPTESQILQEKALLLVTRERELNALRNKHQRLARWLAVSQSLPEIVNPRFSLAEIGSKFVERILSVIKLQRVRLVEIRDDGLRPFGADRITLPALPSTAKTCLLAQRSGLVNEPSSTCEQALAETLRLYRYLWYRVDACPERTIMLVGGFDRERAQSYLPFDQEDLEYFVNAGQHFELLLANVLLLNELAADKARLEQFNDELERRVEERTAELAQAHRRTSEAFSELREKDRRLSEDLSQARAFQQSILPSLPHSGLVEFGAHYEALDLVGGDIYDVAAVAPEHFRVFVADATGHGVQASLRTIVIKSEYDQIKHLHSSPETVLSQLNERLTRTYADNEMLSTGCCFDIRLSAGELRLRYSNAAHPPLLLRDHRGATDEIYHRSSFLALDPETVFRVEERSLSRGDVVIAYSDGFSEQPGPEGRCFDLRKAIEQHLTASRSLQEEITNVHREFERFREAEPQGDDITLVAARVGAP